MSIEVNPIEQHAQTIDLTDQFIKAVGREKYEEARKILQWLEDQGYQDAVLYGGALRDLYIGQLEPKDYDFEVSNVIIRESDLAEVLREEIIISGENRSIILDISSRKEERLSETIEIRALRSDAPINGIAMGRDGIIHAHEHFQKHSEEGIYALRSDLSSTKRMRSMSRFNHFLEKYPNLTLSA